MNVDRLIENASPTIGRAFRLADRHGHEIVVAIAKLTMAVSPRGEASIAAPPSPVRWSDEPYPGMRSTRYPSDVAAEKPGTDAILVGHATPPPGHRGGSFEVRFRVGPVARNVRVFGPRALVSSGKGLVPGAPAPAVRTPLAAELGQAAPSAAVGDLAACIEDADLPGAEGSVGALSPDAEPRARHLGTMDAAWAAERAPVMPIDFDPRYHNVASPGLWSEAPLSVDEPVEVVGATPEGRWIFKLPPFAPRFFVERRDEEAEELPTHLDTFLVDADEGRVELTWRAAVRLPRKAELLRRIAIVQGVPLPDELYRRALEDLDRDIAKRQEAPA